jgi:hypothetical protein
MRRIVVAALFSTIVGSVFAQGGVWRLEGKWVNDDTGENIMIVPDPIGGWQFWSSDFGQARVTSASHQGANIRVEGRGLDCFYLATPTGPNRMHWQLRAGQRECLSRIFSRASG